jgi:diketogulonate reductase-like aldo/keto reductase
MNKRLPNRREFNGLCVALGSSLSSVGAMTVALSSASARAAAAGAASNGAGSTVKFRDGTIVPALGQGSGSLAQGRHPETVEEEALRTGISLGMTLIDTAEVYSNGRAEELIGRVIAGQRDRVFLVSKVWPNHVTGNGIARACEASLARLGTDHLDLYLLHWPSRDTDLSRIVAAFESLRSAGKIRAWGVSNFKVSDMEDLFRVSHGDRCATNQVAYNVGSRGIEHDLLPWCEQHGMPVMAYSPLGGAGASLLRDPTLARIGVAHGCPAAAVALAWTIRNGNVIAIPESGSAGACKGERRRALTDTYTAGPSYTGCCASTAQPLERRVLVVSALQCSPWVMGAKTRSGTCFRAGPDSGHSSVAPAIAWLPKTAGRL